MATAAAPIRFLFESGPDGRYVDVLGNSTLVPGAIVVQNAGSSDSGIYYQVGGGGLNGRVAKELGGRVGAVNAKLQSAYDVRFGPGSFETDSASPPDPPVLTSLLVPVDSLTAVGGAVVGMVYSVGPKLTSAGLTAGVLPLYSAVYLDAMAAIAASPTTVDGFRVTLLSSGIYRGGAPVEPFAHAAAAAIIGAVLTGVQNAHGRLSGLSILVNADRSAPYSMEIDGFSRAAAAGGATVTPQGFTIPSG